MISNLKLELQTLDNEYILKLVLQFKHISTLWHQTKYIISLHNGYMMLPTSHISFTNIMYPHLVYHHIIKLLVQRLSAKTLYFVKKLPFLYIGILGMKNQIFQVNDRFDWCFMAKYGKICKVLKFRPIRTIDTHRYYQIFAIKDIYSDHPFIEATWIYDGKQEIGWSLFIYCCSIVFICKI